MNDYYTSQRLKLNTSNTQVSAFHLNNKLANYHLIIRLNDAILSYNPNPKYLGIVLDRSLTFASHLKQVALKKRSRNNIIQKLTGSNWGTSAESLHTSALSLVYSVAEYCAPAQMNSKNCHLVDTQLNVTMKIISGTLKATNLVWLPVLCNIAPPELRRTNIAKHMYNNCLFYEKFSYFKKLA